MTDEYFQHIGTLRHLIAQNCDQEDIGRLCTVMGTDFARLPGETKLQKVNTLLTRFAKNGQLAELVKEFREDQPQVAWPLLPTLQQFNEKSPNPLNGKSELRSALQNHLESIKEKLQQVDLHGKPAGDEALHQAAALVRDGFTRLDAARKRNLLEFLYEKSYIDRSKPLLALDRANLSDTDLSWITLNGVFLRYINLNGADLSLANLGGADLSGSTLRGVRLRAYLVGAELVKSDLREADLTAAQMANASLAGANLRVANLHGADLRGANLTGADLRYANLQEADLSGANLTFATLDHVNLKGAKLEGTIFDHTDYQSGEEA